MSPACAVPYARSCPRLVHRPRVRLVPAAIDRPDDLRPAQRPVSPIPLSTAPPTTTTRFSPSLGGRLDSMDIQVPRDPFLRALQLVQNIVEPRQTLPILANVLIEAEGAVLRVAATDLEVAARVTVPATVTKPGGITLAARKLVELVRGAARPARDAQAPGRTDGCNSCAGPPRFAWSGSRPRSIRRSRPGTPTAGSRSMRPGCGACCPDELCHVPGREPAVPERRAPRGAPGEMRLVATDGHRLAFARTADRGRHGHERHRATKGGRGDRRASSAELRTPASPYGEN